MPPFATTARHWLPATTPPASRHRKSRRPPRREPCMPADASSPRHAPTQAEARQWSALAVATTGLAHLEATPPVPCQDAAGTRTTPRPVLVVADGAGSSSASDIGARTVVSAMLRLIETLEPQLAWLLDGPQEHSREPLKQFAELLVSHAQGTLIDRAAELSRPVRDLRCTLLLAVLGRERLLWLKVGDGELVLERAKIGRASGRGGAEV